MNFKTTVAVIILAAVFLTGLYAGSLQASGSPASGSKDDPLVTLSFVEENFVPQDELENYMTKDDLEGYVSMDKLEDYVLKEDLEDLDHITATPSKFTVVNLEPGQFLEGKEGTEIILRAGNASVVGRTFDDDTVNGLANVTTGKDLNSGSVPMNHLLLVPRADGRGVMAESYHSDVIFMVKGDYEIK